MFSNDFATLTLYKDGFKKSMCDYVIRFHSDQNDLETVVKGSYYIVKQLIEDYHSKDKTISGRLIAFVEYFHIDKEEVVNYFHPSYKSEVIEDAETFYFHHMLKISERMDNFNHHGSNFIIQRIKEIHIHVNELS